MAIFHTGLELNLTELLTWRRCGLHLVVAGSGWTSPGCTWFCSTQRMSHTPVKETY